MMIQSTIKRTLISIGIVLMLFGVSLFSLTSNTIASEPPFPHPSDTPIIVTVPANELYTDTGIDLSAGDVVNIRVISGTWTWDESYPYSDGIGVSMCDVEEDVPSELCDKEFICMISPQNPVCALPGPLIHPNSLLATILEGEGTTTDTVYYIGNGETITIATSGRLILSMHSANPSAVGSLVVEIDVPNVAPTIIVQGIEVTQGVQNLFNDVPLIAERPTIVRVHVRSDVTIPDAQIKLEGTQGGQPLPVSPLIPSNRGGHIEVLGIADRSKLNDSFYFELPKAWLNGSVMLKLVGETNELDCSSATGSISIAASCALQAVFTPSETVNFRFVPITYEDDAGIEHTPTAGDIDSAVQQIKFTLPVADINLLDPLPVIAFDPGTSFWFRDNDPHPPQSRSDHTRLLGQMKKAEMNFRLSCQPDSTADSRCNSLDIVGGYNEYVIGAIDDSSTVMTDDGTFTAGIAEISGDFATAYIDSQHNALNYTLAHEIGHLAGARHAPCGGATHTDPNYPSSDGYISDEQDQTSGQTFYGVDIYALGIDARNAHIYPPNTPDLMGYCSPRWISGYTYTKILDGFNARFGSQQTAHRRNQITSDTTMQSVLLVTGLVSGTSSGEISPVYQFETAADVPSIDSGSYTIHLEDANGSTLISYPFEPTFFFEEESTPPGDAAATFTLVLPHLPSEQPAHQIVLSHNGQPLHSRSISANAPTVSITAPSAGDVWDGDSGIVRWEAADADGDALLFTVLLSTDGGNSWMPLATDVYGSQIEVDTDWVSGAENALIRVLASDGFLSASAQMNVPFEIASHAPNAFIHSPDNGRLFVGDQLIVLNGSGFDMEDRLRTEAAFTWHSDLDGVLGNGKRLDVVASQLSVGSHLITLEAADSEGKVGTESIMIQIYDGVDDLPPLAITMGAADIQQANWPLLLILFMLISVTLIRSWHRLI